MFEQIDQTKYGIVEYFYCFSGLTAECIVQHSYDKFTDTTPQFLFVKYKEYNENITSNSATAVWRIKYKTI